MDEPNHIVSRVSSDVMKIQVPIIWQEFPFKKNAELPKRSAHAKVMFNFKTKPEDKI